MAECWDTVVIGAGMGGLAAALRLANGGWSVSVVESNSHPGGTAFVYFRKGFSFPMGPLGISSPLIIREILDKLCVEPPELKRVHYRLRAFDLDIPVSLAFTDMKKELKKLFPADAEAVESFFTEVRNLDLSSNAHHDKASRQAMEKAANTPAQEFLGRRVSDYRLRRILGSMGAREPYSNMLLIGAMWLLLCEQGIWYPQGGVHDLAQRLSDMISQNKSCEVRLGAAVDEILVEKGRVQGVRLASGEKITAGSVVSNADFKRTFLELIRPEYIPPEFLSQVESARQTESVFQVCLGVHADSVDLGAFKHGTRIIYQRHPRAGEGTDRRLAGIDADELAAQELEISLWSDDGPDLAPAGKAVIVIRTEADYNHFSRFRTGPLQRTAEYGDYKMKLGRALVSEASSVVPGLSESIEVMDVATPLTFSDRGGRSEGAVAGWSWDFEDNRDYEARALLDTPVAGLYMAGYQAFSSLFAGGVPTALKSGTGAAEKVIAGAGPDAFINLPGTRG